ncbi:hypothetical protein ASD24_24910 [Paenibacillus sp. Root52]|uniref:DUF5662 family protein n=1 Tax=Paenibacillus sp. Root52 TaxID=1736552 RepID=UPI0006F71C0B|nr:DUF5662 family protein [Paenibacillus sp. Root52]KQY91040.1 hypothetical protein ASD24_24910 [Paenibacillus sp. Root52]
MTKVVTYTEEEYVRDTRAHISSVQQHMQTFAALLKARSVVHDKSKFEEPEKSILHQNTVEYRRYQFGSVEYQSHLEKVKVALDHHYGVNSHHPQHYLNGVAGMDLLDIVEMFCDWMAACNEHGDGKIINSILENKKRFNYSEELTQILINTATRLEPNK